VGSKSRSNASSLCPLSSSVRQIRQFLPLVGVNLVLRKAPSRAGSVILLVKAHPPKQGRHHREGIEAFLGEEETQGKAAFHLFRKLLLALDDVWLELRRESRKLRKSDIVA